MGQARASRAPAPHVPDRQARPLSQPLRAQARRVKAFARAGIAGAMRRTGLYAALGRSPWRRGIVILLYHRVGAPHVPWLMRSIPLPAFDRHMAHLRREYDVLSLEQAVDYLRGGDPLPVRGVVVTFDDGYADTYEQAFPVLVERGIPATVFLSTGPIDDQRLFWFERLRYAAHVAAPGSGNALFHRLIDEARAASPWSPGVVERLIADLGVQVPAGWGQDRVLTWEQVGEMARAGIAFGGHTAGHPCLPHTPTAERRRELTAGLAALRAHVSSAFRPFAYPMGDFDPELERLCAETGYDCALTCEAQAPPATVCLYRIGRLTAPADLGEFRLRVAGLPTGVPGGWRRGTRPCRAVWRPIGGG